jgi:hypothetical protein
LAWLIGTSLHGIRLRTTLVLRDVPSVFNFAKSSVHYLGLPSLDKDICLWAVYGVQYTPTLTVPTVWHDRHP